MASRSFIRPDRSALGRLTQDDSIRATYTDSLALIHDLLCGFTADHGRPRFLDEQDLSARIEATYSPDDGGVPSSEANRPILDNIEKNARRAIELRNEAGSQQDLTAASVLSGEITGFLDGLVSTYRDVILPKAGGPRPHRAARA